MRMKQLFKRLVFGGILLFQLQSFAQNRNERMREMNRIVEMMNAFSSCNQQWYFDAVQLQKALYRSSEKLNESYFYCSKTQHSGTVSFAGIEAIFRFREITPDAQKRIPAYQVDYLPWLETREVVLKTLAKTKNGYMTIAPVLTKYLHSADSLYSVHTALNEYISAKQFRSDSLFVNAQTILKKHAYWFEQCHLNSQELDQTLVNYCNQSLPPFLSSHKELQQGLQELNLTMNLLTNWERDLYRENLSNNVSYDTQLRLLNAEGLKNDSLYLYKTRGYGNLSSGFWLHTRYRTFYTSMQSNLYWFAASKHAPEPFIKQSQQAYNDFVRSYNSIIEDYNDYIAIADGLTFTQTSACCLSKSEIDTNQNVLLMAPRLLYKFEYTPHSINETESIPTATAWTPEELLIQKAAPHHLIYLLDASSSMNESGKLTHLKENATQLVAIQRETDRISIVTFSGKSEVILRAVPCDQKKPIQEKIDRIRAFGQTNIQNGLQTVEQFLLSDKLEKGVNAVLVLTDGEFPLNAETRTLLSGLKAGGIEIYFVYLGKPLSKKAAKNLEKTYGDLNITFYDTNRIHLKEALLKIASE